MHIPRLLLVTIVMTTACRTDSRQCKIGDDIFELTLTNTAIECAPGDCHRTSPVGVDIDWLTKPSEGWDAWIPLRVVRVDPAEVTSPALDGIFSGFGSTDLGFTVTVNTGPGSGVIDIPTTALDAEGTTSATYVVEYGVSTSLSDTDNLIRVNGNPPYDLDPSECNKNAPEINVTIR